MRILRTRVTGEISISFIMVTKQVTVDLFDATDGVQEGS